MKRLHLQHLHFLALTVFASLASLAALAFAPRLFAAEITPQQARTATANWLRKTPTPLGARMNSTVVSSTSYADANNITLFHVVSLAGGGFVVTSADDGIWPVIAFSEDGEFVASDDNPLWSLLHRDLDARAATLAQKRAAQTAPAAAPQSSQSTAATTATAASPETQWAGLLATPPQQQGFAPAAASLSSVNDTRVAPLVQSQWSQGTPGTQGIYNYYAPNYYYSGCVATAGGQVMRYYQWPQAPVEPGSYTCAVDDAPTQKTMIGGVYDWANMPLIPAASPTIAEQQAVGKLLYDGAVTVGMNWTSEGSGAYINNWVSAFTNRFGYASAAYTSFADYPNFQKDAFANTVLANLDAGQPVILGIDNYTSGQIISAHAIVGDGYGYTDSALYVHLNLGWAGVYTAWYNPPDIGAGYDFNTIRDVVYNISPTATGEVVSGRVLDALGSPVSDASVCATDDNGALRYATTGSNGIYAFHLPSSKTYTLTATVPGLTAAGSVSVGRSDSNETGSRWGNDLTLAAAAQPVFEAGISGAGDTLPQTGGSLPVTIMSTIAWTAESDAAWLALSQNSGAASAQITASADPSTSVVSRTATITFTAGGQTPITLTITQRGTFQITPEHLNIARGAPRQFTAEGAAGNTVVWSLSGNNNPDTTLDPDTGLLTVAPAETSRALTLTAAIPALSFSLNATAHISRAAQVAAGNLHSLWVKNGRASAAGANNAGQLGINTTDAAAHPTPVDITPPASALDNATIVSVAAGHSHSFLVTSDGKLYAFGDNTTGQLGLGDTTARTTPTLVPLPDGVFVVAVATGGDITNAFARTFLLTDDGRLFATGYGGYGALGAGSYSDKSTFVDVTPAGQFVTDVDTGLYHALFATAGGTLFGTGLNTGNYGELGLGLGAYIYEITPTELPLANASSVAASYERSFAIAPDGALSAVGCNPNGQLGAGNTATLATFTNVTPAGQVASAVSAAYNHTLLLTSAGQLFAAGYNASGQLGDATTAQRTTFVNVTPAGATIAQIAAGGCASGATGHSLLVTTTGEYLATGNNSKGQLGLGDTQNRLTPLPIALPAAPAITTQPQDATVTAGQTATATFTIAATGNPAPACRWQISTDAGATWNDLDDDATYSGVSATTLTITGATAAMNGYQYHCLAENSLDTATSDPATLTVNSQPNNLAQLPAAQTIAEGDNITYTATASGNPAPTYRWQISTDAGATWNDLPDDANAANAANAAGGADATDGADGDDNDANNIYSGATTDTLTITGATAAMNGNQYRYIASNGIGAPDGVPSNATTLTVEFAPSITTQPISQTVTAGQTATFTISATGNPAPAYQWRKNTVSIPDATNATYTITNAQPSDASAYTVIVSNTAGAVTSEPALLTVLTLPAIEWAANAGSQTVLDGETATFAINITAGTEPLTCTWYKNGAPIANAATATYATPPALLSDNGATYKIEVSNTAGAASLTATLTVNPSATTLAKQVKAQLETPGPGAVTLSGTLDFTQVGGVTIAPGKTILGADSDTTITGGLTIPATANNVTITGVTFTDGALAIEGASGVLVGHCTFTDAPVSVTGGADDVTFSWNKFTAISGDGSAMRIDGAGANTGVILDHNLFGDGLKSDMPAVTDARVIMSNNYIAAGEAEGAGEAGGAESAAGNNTTATIAGAGAQILSINNIYQDVNNPLTQENGGLIRAYDNFTISTTGTIAPGTDTVFVPDISQVMQSAPLNADTLAAQLTAGAGNTKGRASPTPAQTNGSARITAAVTGPGAFATATAAGIPAGGGFTLTAGATGFAPAAWQWYRDNFAIAGARASTYTVANATPAANTGAYSVALTTPAPAADIVTAPAFTVTIGELSLPVITKQPASQTIAAGAGSVTFSVTATGENLKYQWRKNGVDIPGATSPGYTILYIQQSQVGAYTVVVSNAAGSVTSDTATLTLNSGSGSGGNSSGSGGDGGNGGGGGAPSPLYLAAALALLGVRAACPRKKP